MLHSKQCMLQYMCIYLYVLFVCVCIRYVVQCVYGIVHIQCGIYCIVFVFNSVIYHTYFTLGTYVTYTYMQEHTVLGRLQQYLCLLFYSLGSIYLRRYVYVYIYDVYVLVYIICICGMILVHILMYIIYVYCVVYGTCSDIIICV